MRDHADRGWAPERGAILIHVKTGKTGLRGVTGKIGETGSRGPAGPTGPTGPIMRRVDVLKIVQAEFMNLRRQLDMQFGRMFQIQHRIDRIHALVKRLILQG